ncbi:MAG: sigma-70 family polymerase sigma factor [Solirubrobacteraceae bacterium]|nr:sigma-70 family polymerase sigma factor [Solirubrobacteraceae bacterium]
MIPFQRFLDEHRDSVWRFSVASVGPQEADDVFQETFLAAMRAYPRLRAGSNLQAWVMTIAHRKALDHHRARDRRPFLPGDVPEVASHDPTPGADPVWERVRALPNRQRAAVTLRYAADLDYAAIGAALGCSADAARRSAHEGIKKLRQEAIA